MKSFNCYLFTLYSMFVLYLVCCRQAFHSNYLESVNKVPFGCNSLTGCLTLFCEGSCRPLIHQFQFQFLCYQRDEILAFKFLMALFHSSSKFENIWLIYIFEPTASSRPLLHCLIEGISPNGFVLSGSKFWEYLVDLHI